MSLFIYMIRISEYYTKKTLRVRCVPHSLKINLFLAATNPTEFVELRPNPNGLIAYDVEIIKLATFGTNNNTKCEKIQVVTGEGYLCKVQLDRYSGYYIMQVYLPNILTVLSVWFSLFFPVDGGRISICKLIYSLHI